jgi:hypothetical protein
VITKIVQKGRLYKLIGVVQSLVVECSTKFKKNDLLYQRCTHVFLQALRNMDKNNLVESMDFHAKDILVLVHIDLCGLMTTSHGRTKYFLTFINDFLKKTFFYTMKIKLVCLTSLKFSKFW